MKIAQWCSLVAILAAGCSRDPAGTPAPGPSSSLVEDLSGKTAVNAGRRAAAVARAAFSNEQRALEDVERRMEQE